MITQARGWSGSTAHPSQPDGHLPPAPRAGAQPFDRVAADYELNGKDLIGPWPMGLTPAANRRAIDLGCGAGRHAVLLPRKYLRDSVRSR
ncbi:MAG TPA: hypothetical protein VFJ07_13340 [Streptosporangiaceae bacterium]|nr:hypothetical protein [Streptosporangiaceae bacterium]